MGSVVLLGNPLTQDVLKVMILQRLFEFFLSGRIDSFSNDL